MQPIIIISGMCTRSFQSPERTSRRTFLRRVKSFPFEHLTFPISSSQKAHQSSALPSKPPTVFTSPSPSNPNPQSTIHNPPYHHQQPDSESDPCHTNSTRTQRRRDPIKDLKTPLCITTPSAKSRPIVRPSLAIPEFWTIRDHNRG